MRIEASVGRGAKMTDSISTRVGKLTLTAEMTPQLSLPYSEYHELARLFRQIDEHGLRHIVDAAEAADK